MFGSGFCDFSLWWIFPLVMMAVCFFMMRGRRGAMMCGVGPRKADPHHQRASDPGLDLLDKWYALGEIDRKEYERGKSILTDAS
jgi:hypothetical protein